MMARIGRGGVIAAVILAAAATLSGQPASPARQEPGGDVVHALLVEVRGLRAAMEQMASAGPRVQLFASRLQLQESRINNMIRRLEAVRESAATARRQYDEAVQRVAQAESALSSGVPPDIPRNEMENVVKGRKNEAISAKAAFDRYSLEENQLAADLTMEQARWNDINQRLDELERILAVKK